MRKGDMGRCRGREREKPPPPARRGKEGRAGDRVEIGGVVENVLSSAFYQTNSFGNQRTRERSRPMTLHHWWRGRGGKGGGGEKKENRLDEE